MKYISLTILLAALLSTGCATTRYRDPAAKGKLNAVNNTTLPADSFP